MLRYHAAFYLPRGDDRMVVAKVLDFPEAATQGFDLADARSMVASALQEMAQIRIEDGLPLPMPDEGAHNPGADLVELIPLSIEVGGLRVHRSAAS